MYDGLCGLTYQCQANAWHKSNNELLPRATFGILTVYVGVLHTKLHIKFK